MAHCSLPPFCPLQHFWPSPSPPTASHNTATYGSSCVGRGSPHRDLKQVSELFGGCHLCCAQSALTIWNLEPVYGRLAVTRTSPLLQCIFRSATSRFGGPLCNLSLRACIWLPPPARLYKAADWSSLPHQAHLSPPQSRAESSLHGRHVWQR